MDDRKMRSHVDQVLAGLEAEQLEERIAPVKCEKNPEAAECMSVALYGIEPAYGIEDPGGG